MPSESYTLPNWIWRSIWKKLCEESIGDGIGSEGGVGVGRLESKPSKADLEENRV